MLMLDTSTPRSLRVEPMAADGIVGSFNAVSKSAYDSLSSNCLMASLGLSLLFVFNVSANLLMFPPV